MACSTVVQWVALWGTPKAGARAVLRVAPRADRKAAMSELHSSGF
jgi:hypothetical protein